ncbi:unnamed protein product [Spirodela intermedia]|uniref:Uncharacterized protein n=1 Tax=Spirodela intermedia TaxID=51605 RepID=A0A7I8J0U5_SPIIN|nr:unnamed protein product [Spirodela intermedia]CAA6663433.1 unnamed protein product [Spirodela intermedia]
MPERKKHGGFHEVNNGSSNTCYSSEGEEEMITTGRETREAEEESIVNKKHLTF